MKVRLKVWFNIHSFKWIFLFLSQSNGAVVCMGAIKLLYK